MFDAVSQDLRIAFRLLRKSPVFTLTAALSLAIGIGANTAIFSVVNALLFKSAPGIARPGDLVDVGRVREGRGFGTSSYPNYLDLEQRVSALSGLAAFRVEPVAMSLRDAAAAGEAERLYTTTVSGNYFNVLGTRAAAGRLFVDRDDQAARVAPTMVLSYALWDRKYRRDASVVGRAVIVNGVSTTIVGVAEPGFRGSSFIAADAWLPIGSTPAFNPRGEAMLSERRIVWLLLVGRVSPSSTTGQAQVEISTVARQLAAEHPDSNKDTSWRIAASSTVPAPFQGMVSGFLAVLMVIVALVLSISCVNLAGVLLARGAHRQREISVRLAVGAGRGRVVRQLVTETLLIFGIGCAGGLLLSLWLTGMLAATTAVLPVPVAMDLAPDGRVILFAVGVSLVSGLLSGLVPAVQAARTDIVMAIKEGSGSQATGRQRIRGALLVGQVALSCVLFLAAALFARSLQQADRIDPGFDASGVDVVSLDMSMGGYRGDQAVRFGERLVARARAVPGVRHAALARMIPMSGGGMSFGALVPAGHDPRLHDIGADWNVVTPGYFEALRIPIVAGRALTPADRAGAPRVAVINETFARRAWPSVTAVGQRLVNDNPDGRRELIVVGVARDGKYRTLGEQPVPYIYVPHAQQAGEEMFLLVKNEGPGTALPAIRAALRELNPNMPIIAAQQLADAAAVSLLPQRIAVRLAGSLGLVGLLLAAVGIYGVTAFSAAQRTREIGVRMALGAPRGHVIAMVVRKGFGLAAAGVGVGLVAGVLGAQLLSSFLYGLGARDPFTLITVGTVFLFTAGLASYLPARAAARIAPLKALRLD